MEPATQDAPQGKRTIAEDVTLLAATVTLIAIGFLPWSNGRFVGDETTGYDGPLRLLMKIGVTTAVAMTADVMAKRFTGQSIATAVGEQTRGLVHLVLGITTLACVALVYLRVMDNATVAVLIALGAAGTICYHGYLIFWLNRGDPGSQLD